MAETIYIGNDINTAEMKVLFCEQDFIALVEQYMGSDAARRVEGLIAAQNEIRVNHEQELREAYDEGASDSWAYGDYESYENGRDDGYEAGYTDGYGRGYSDGFDAGYQQHNPWRLT